MVLSGGFPARDLFPFTSLSAACSDGTHIELLGAALTSAQQYNLSLRGQPPLLAWATEHMAALHRPPASAGHEVLITNGGNHSLEMVLSLFLDHGDALLVEEYSYPVVVESIAVPKGYVPVGVPMDSQGIVPEALEELLARLAAEHAADPVGHLFPKLLYTIPNGQNPTGATMPLDRKHAVYAACRRHGLIIVEDDPYCYLRYGAAALAAAENPGPAAMPGLAGAAAEGSYLGLDADGRVIRVDSFAKFLAPGEQRLSGRCRAWSWCPWCSLFQGPRPLTHLRRPMARSAPGLGNGRAACRPQAHLHYPGAHGAGLQEREQAAWAVREGKHVLTRPLTHSQVGPCSLSQALVSATLAAWGDRGLDMHLRRVQAEYARRARLMLAAADRELSGLAQWVAPTVGMFLWVRLLGEEDSGEAWRELSEAGVIVIPGKPLHWR